MNSFYQLNSDTEFTIVLRCSCKELLGLEVGIEPAIEQKMVLNDFNVQLCKSPDVVANPPFGEVKQ